MYIGFDDTDSPKGMCTTYLAYKMVKTLKKEKVTFLDFPNLIRFNPNIPWKTRGNGAVGLTISTDNPQKIKRMIKKLIEIGHDVGKLDVLNVHEDQAKEFICNSIEINDTIVTPTDMFSLSFSGRKTYISDMSEFMKSGGAIKCLTLRL